MTDELTAAVESAMAIYRDVKVRACRDAKGPADTVMMLHYHAVDGMTGVVAVPFKNDLPDAVRYARRQFGKPKWLVLLADVRLKFVEPGERVNVPADFGQAQRDGDLSIVEGLTAVGTDGTTTVTRLARYGFGDDGLPLFAEEPFVPSEMTGRTLDALLLAWPRGRAKEN